MQAHGWLVPPDRPEGEVRFREASSAGQEKVTVYGAYNYCFQFINLNRRTKRIDAAIQATEALTILCEFRWVSSRSAPRRDLSGSFKK